MGTRQVRRILRLEERANRWLERWGRAHRRAVRARARAFAILDEVIGAEHRLTARQRAELQRARERHHADVEHAPNEALGPAGTTPVPGGHEIPSDRADAAGTPESSPSPTPQEAHAWTTTDPRR